MTRHPPTWSAFFLGAQLEVEHACKLISSHSDTSGRSIFPSAEHVLAAFWLTPLYMLKAVIIGQDPYHNNDKRGVPKAVGVCFGSHRDSDIPASLANVYKELENTVEDWKNPGHPDIKSWGREGVLLLNAALTVEAGCSGSHSGFWKPFTEKLMEYFNEHCKDLVFLLWGGKAKTAADTIYASKHLKLDAYHPSPTNTTWSFLGCNHFNLANQHLAEKGIRPIDWRVK
jgi:uracil-DNA glycosylase